MSNKYWIDTNIILRFLLNDHTLHSPLAKQLMINARQGKAVLKVSPIVVLEAVHVMRYEYDYSKTDIQSALTKFENMIGIEFEEREIVLEALHHYKEYGKVSFGDAYIAAKARYVLPNHVLTFNYKDLTKTNMTQIVVQKLGDTDNDPKALNVFKM